MAIKLDYVDLPDLLFDDGGFGRVPVAAVAEQSVVNTPIIFESEKAGGFLLNLVGTETSGWIEKAVMDALMALASVAGATYILEYEGTFFTVRFRHEDSPVLFAVPIIERPDIESSDWYNNVFIKLMEVL